MPSFLSSARERHVWQALWSAPDANVRLKKTDHEIVARYCHFRAELDKLMSQRIPPTHTVTTTVGAKAVRPNPLYTHKMMLHKECTAIETALGLTPKSRLDLQAQLVRVRDDGDKSPSAQPPASSQPVASGPQKPASPIGLLAMSSPPPGGAKH